ncbi:MAG TPA: hypothetical protein VF787_02590 [Thermoanaerobaculia bacterium]
MNDDPQLRGLNERTGRHFCIRCLAPVAADEYLRNDHICNKCAANPEYPLASTPDEPKKKKER